MAHPASNFSAALVQAHKRYEEVQVRDEDEVDAPVTRVFEAALRETAFPYERRLHQIREGDKTSPFFESLSTEWLEVQGNVELHNKWASAIGTPVILEHIDNEDGKLIGAALGDGFHEVSLEAALISIFSSDTAALGAAVMALVSLMIPSLAFLAYISLTIVGMRFLISLQDRIDLGNAEARQAVLAEIVDNPDLETLVRKYGISSPDDVDRILDYAVFALDEVQLELARMPVEVSKTLGQVEVTMNQRSGMPRASVQGIEFEDVRGKIDLERKRILASIEATPDDASDRIQVFVNQDASHDQNPLHYVVEGQVFSAQELGQLKAISPATLAALRPKVFRVFRAFIKTHQERIDSISEKIRSIGDPSAILRDSLLEVYGRFHPAPTGRVTEQQLRTALAAKHAELSYELRGCKDEMREHIMTNVCLDSSSVPPDTIVSIYGIGGFPLNRLPKGFRLPDDPRGDTFLKGTIREAIEPGRLPTAASPARTPSRPPTSFASPDRRSALAAVRSPMSPQRRSMVRVGAEMQPATKDTKPASDIAFTTLHTHVLASRLLHWRLKARDDLSDSPELYQAVIDKTDMLFRQSMDDFRESLQRHHQYSLIGAAIGPLMDEPLVIQQTAATTTYIEAVLRRQLNAFKPKTEEDRAGSDRASTAAVHNA